MKTILALCISDKLSGGELFLVRLLEELAHNGWDTAILGGPNPALESECIRAGIPYVAGELGPKLGKATAARTVLTFARQARELRSVLSKHPSDVLLVQYKLEQLLLGGDVRDRTTVVLEHGPIPAPVLRVPLLRRRYLRTLKSASVVFGASRPAMEILTSLGEDPVMLPAGVRLDRPQVEPLRRGIGLFAGRLEPNKGIREAIELVRRSRGLTLVIAGSGSLEGEVRAACASDPDVLRFVGHVPDIDRLILESDFGILLTSDPGEGRPLFALECLARGRPVIGAAGSAAMRDLAAEVASTGVILLNEGQIAASKITDDMIRPIEPVSASWARTASRFETALAPHLNPGG